MTESARFQPFTDRTSRDIRNALSSSLLDCLDANSILPAKEAARKFDPESLPQCYRRYIRDRLDRYNKAVELVSDLPDDPVTKSTVLWNLGLFFEVHEVLEHAWYDARGDYKLILQALIRAAGVYIKLEYGYRDPAKRMAAKALTVLEEHQDSLHKWFKPEPLLKALRELSSPPRLSV